MKEIEKTKKEIEKTKEEQEESGAKYFDRVMKKIEEWQKKRADSEGKQKIIKKVQKASNARLLLPGYMFSSLIGREFISREFIRGTLYREFIRGTLYREFIRGTLYREFIRYYRYHLHRESIIGCFYVLVIMVCIESFSPSSVTRAQSIQHKLSQGLKCGDKETQNIITKADNFITKEVQAITTELASQTCQEQQSSNVTRGGALANGVGEGTGEDMRSYYKGILEICKPGGVARLVDKVDEHIGRFCSNI